MSRTVSPERAVVRAGPLSCFFVICAGGLASACATQTYTLKTIPAEAEIFLVGEKDLDKPIKTLGKGSATLKGDDLAGRIYAIRGKNLQRILLVFPRPNEEGTVTLSIPPADPSLQARISELETQINAERRLSTDLKAAAEKRARSTHDIGRLVAFAQRNLSLGATAEAERIVGELFAQPEDFLPAAAYTLRAKVRLTQNKRAEARADLMKAVSLSEKETEAKALLESAR